MDMPYNKVSNQFRTRLFRCVNCGNEKSFFTNTQSKCIESYGQFANCEHCHNIAGFTKWEEKNSNNAIRELVGC